MPLYQQLIAFYSIFRQELNRFTRIWTQSILPSAITMALYFIIFGAFIGSQVSDIDGFSYMQFIVPGLIMMVVITNAFSNVAFSFFGMKFMRTVDELIISPTPNYIIMLGYCLGGIARGVIVGLIVTIVSLIFVPFEVHNILLVLLFVILTALTFSLAGFTNAIFAKKFDDVGIIPTFVLTPLTYLGGIFYSIHMLPEFWQKISLFNPILYMINGFRYGFLGISDINIWIGLIILLAVSTALFFINLYLLNKGTGLKQ